MVRASSQVGHKLIDRHTRVSYQSSQRPKLDTLMAVNGDREEVRVPDFFHYVVTRLGDSDGRNRSSANVLAGGLGAGLGF